MDTYGKKPMDKLLDIWEKEKKDKYGNKINYQWKHFYSFSLSVDGMLEKEAIVVLKILSRLIVEKIEEYLSQVHGWVNVRITIEVMRL